MRLDRLAGRAAAGPKWLANEQLRRASATSQRGASLLQGFVDLDVALQNLGQQLGQIDYPLLLPSRRRMKSPVSPIPSKPMVAGSGMAAPSLPIVRLSI